VTPPSGSAAASIVAAVGYSTDARGIFGEQFPDARVFFASVNTGCYLRERAGTVAAQRLSRP
jgi:hypothetical protein